MNTKYDLSLPIKVVKIEARKNTHFDLYIENAIAAYVINLGLKYGENDDFKVTLLETIVNPSKELITHVFEVGLNPMSSDEYNDHMVQKCFNLRYTGK